MDLSCIYILVPLFIGCLADCILGDPTSLPHPIVGFGKIISWGNKIFNKGNRKVLKGAIFSLCLILISFFSMYYILWGLELINIWLKIIFSSIVVFYCLAGKTLIDEVKQVFVAVDTSLDAGRKQVARIVGRDTSQLSRQQIQKASLETLAENLSDGVIAPLFWFAILGTPGMFAYKMINTLDSMIGYKNDKYKDFGCWAAHIDDIANYIPARLTAVLMAMVSGKKGILLFVKRYGSQHASPNSGYPESALAGILNCRFGGPNSYFGQIVDKPYIGNNERELSFEDMIVAISVNKKVEISMIVLITFFVCSINMCNKFI